MERDELLYPNGNPRPGSEASYAAGYDPETGIARDPRDMDQATLRALGHGGPLLQAVRQNCRECQSGNEAEVRRCRMVWCPFWPYRMGSNPFHRQELSSEQREERRRRLATAREARRENPEPRSS